MNITGNTILITGGTSGIGRSLAEALHAKGNKVVVAGRRQELLGEVARKNPGIDGLRLDVTDSSSIEEFVGEVKRKYPELNVLINNAGISKPEEYNADPVEPGTAMAIVQTNIVSVIQITAALLPLLREQPRATLMATTSGLAFVPLAGYPTYCASKAFVHSWLETLRMQLRGTSVEVLELAPPYVQTELGGPEMARDPNAMPLAAFTDEVMRILEQNTTEQGEILVEGVKSYRYAEREGRYDETLQALAGH